MVAQHVTQMATVEADAGRHPVDAPVAIFTAAYVVSLNHMVVNIQPLLLGALAKDYGLTDRHLGQVSAVYIGFITLLSLSGPFWVRRVNWRLFTMIAAVVSAGVLLWGATIHTTAMFMLLFAILGAIKGCMGVPPFASLGDASNPDRAYAVSAILQGLMSAAVAAPLAAYIIPHYGLSGLLITLAAIYATGLVAALWLPARGRIRVTNAQSAAPSASLLSTAAIPPLVAALGLALFMGGILAFWYFVERIGASRGVPAGLIGMTLSATALASMSTSALNAWLGGRFPTIAFIVVGTAVILSGYATLLIPGDVAFVVANLLFALGWGFATPAYWAILRKVDSTGRLFVVAPAASGLAGVVIGMVSGPIIEAGGYSGILSVSTALMVTAIGAVGLASVMASRRA